jgi:precorrin-3B methylase
MSIATDVLKTLRQVVLMNDKIERLERLSEKQEEITLDLRDRLIRIEAIIEFAQTSAHVRKLPPGD